MKSVWFYISIFILSIIPVVIAVLIIHCLWNDKDTFLKCTLSGLIIFVFFSSYYFTWLLNQYFNRYEAQRSLLRENEKKRLQEELHFSLNLNYRLEALKWEKLYSVIKEITEKKEDTSKKNEKTITFSINHSLIQEIKKVMDEIDKIK